MKTLLILALITTACGSAKEEKITSTNSAQGSSITIEKSTPPVRPLPEVEGFSVQTESMETCVYYGNSLKCETRFYPEMNCQKATVMLRIVENGALWTVKADASVTAGEYIVLRFEELPRGFVTDYSTQSQTSVQCLD